MDELISEISMEFLQDFKRDGFVYLPGFLDQDEIVLVNQKLDRFIVEKVPQMPSDQVYYECKSDKSTLKQLQQLFKYDPFFYEMMFASRFELLASMLLDDTAIGKNMQYFNKPPKTGKPTPAHQDGHYFMLAPNEALTMWMALEPIDQENGCVRYVKGSHKKGLREHGQTQTLGFSQGITDFGTDEDLANEVYLPTKAGDLLVHHALTIHWAEGNNSAYRSRKAMGFIYYAEKAKEDKIAHAAYAEKLEEALKRKGKI